MKRLPAALGLGLLLLAAVLLLRAALFSSQQVEVEPVPPIEVDVGAVAQRLGALVRHRTISHQQTDLFEPDAFRALHRALADSYPQTHRSLERETVNEWSLLYTWKGRNPALRPALLVAHIDVVPIDADSAGDWTHPPFAGVVENGTVWGRGTLDDKGTVICILEAVERLLSEGFLPERTIYLALGHDEELGGDEGALAMAELLAARGVELEWVLDEGGVVAQGFLPGAEFEVAVIGIAEKGSVGIALDLEAAGGHSATPPRHSAIGELAQAVVRLEANPMPGAIDGATASLLDELAPHLGFWPRVVVANRWLFGPFIAWGFTRLPTLDALLRTTTAVTIFEAGVKENVLPIRARAIANFRIHPRDDIEAVARHVRETIRDDRIELQIGVRSKPRNPSPISPVDSAAFRLIQRTVGEVFAGVAAVPYLVIGGTDARHYYLVSDNVYRFSPYVLGQEAVRLIHGTDEHVGFENLAGGVRFFVQLLRSSGEPAQPPSS